MQSGIFVLVLAGAYRVEMALGRVTDHAFPASAELQRKIGQGPFRVSIALSSSTGAGKRAPLHPRTFMPRILLEVRRSIKPFPMPAPQQLNHAAFSNAAAAAASAPRRRERAAAATW